MKFLKLTVNESCIAISCDKITGMIDYNNEGSNLKTDIFVENDTDPYRVNETIDEILKKLEDME